MAGPAASEQGQVIGDHSYARPRWHHWLTRVPGDLKDYAKESFRRENALAISLVALSTGLLIWKDQYVVDGARKLGDRLHISHSANQRTFASVDLGLTTFYFQGPYDSGSALYFLGDGWIDMWFAGGFLGYGWLRSDNRALQTSSQIVESVLASGAVVQVLKHTTGRESPFVATEDGGKWTPFPNQFEYHKRVPHYDAFPSGHLAAGMAAITVMAENYPEYRYIRPVGYTLMTLLSFQMLNNGVHWASDYPLSVALGYGFGKLAVRKGRSLKKPAKAAQGGMDLQWMPAAFPDGFGLKARLRFG